MAKKKDQGMKVNKARQYRCRACGEWKENRSFYNEAGEQFDICDSCRSDKKKSRKVGAGEILCTHCGRILLATEDNFYVVNGTFYTPCKECRKDERKKRYYANQEDEVQKSLERRMKRYHENIDGTRDRDIAYQKQRYQLKKMTEGKKVK